MWLEIDEHRNDDFFFSKKGLHNSLEKGAVAAVLKEAIRHSLVRFVSVIFRENVAIRSAIINCDDDAMDMMLR